MESELVQRLHHKVQCIHLIPVDSHLRQIGHKDQDHTGIYFPQLPGRAHPVRTSGELDIHEYDIELLLEHAGASPRDAIAFGDAAIDLPMFEACGFSVAMGNASEAVKAAADFVTDDVGADGLAKAFARLGLS